MMVNEKKDFILMQKMQVLGLIDLYEQAKESNIELQHSLDRSFMAFQMNRKSLEEYEELIEKYHDYYENLFKAYKELKESYDELIESKV